MTIFDILTHDNFRKRPAMYIGRGDLQTLETWLSGYRIACETAGEYERLRTKNGVPFRLLRDYIALNERDTSTGGIAFILQKAAGGDSTQAMERFFEYVDRYVKLEIKSVKRAFMPPDATAANELAAIDTGAKIVSLTEGLCWRLLKSPILEPVQEVYLCLEQESFAKRLMRQRYGKGLRWVIVDEPCYPAYELKHIASQYGFNTTDG